MKTKHGISLIVLVITIIVMTILAGAIILTLNNSGIINKATDAVKQTNIAAVREVAQMAWAEAYIDGARTQEELKAAVDNALAQSNITEDMYEGYGLIVTEKGVSLEEIEYVDFALDSTNWEKIGYHATCNGEYSNDMNYCVDGWESDIKELTIPETFYDEEDGVWYKVTSVNMAMTDIEKLVVPDSVTDIWFEACMNLVSVNIPKGMKVAVGFIECLALQEIVIPQGVTNIQGDAFIGTSLERITIPNTVKSIGRAFDTELKEITYTGTIQEWNSISFSEGWWEIWYDDGITVTATVHCTDGDISIESHNPYN